MQYISVAQASKKWNISDRMVRNYCAQGRVDGAVLVGKTWNVPATAQKPHRVCSDNTLLAMLKREKAVKLSGGIYHKTQIELTYNSNYIEGSTLSHDQTRYIFETNTIGVANEIVNIDDVVETANHFRCVDFVIEQANKPISETMIKHLHFILKNGTSDSRKEWFNVGDYKKMPNEVGGVSTCEPQNVKSKIAALLENYNALQNKSLDDVLAFHVSFERIHPFQDGNGRVGRLLMFKECLANNIVPFVIDDEHKLFYYRGIKEWGNVNGYLRDTCLSCQDKYKLWLDYFKIEY